MQRATVFIEFLLADFPVFHQPPIPAYLQSTQGRVIENIGGLLFELLSDYITLTEIMPLSSPIFHKCTLSDFYQPKHLKLLDFPSLLLLLKCLMAPAH